MQTDAYPLTYDVDYPERKLSRLTTFFRIFTVIPIAIVLSVITGSSSTYGAEGDVTTVVVGGVGLLFLPPLLMILFRRKYPRWWLDWNRELLRFSNRVGAYVLLLDDQYPSTDEEQSVHVDFEYPDVDHGLNRWLPLVKWLLAIPHYIVLFFLWIGLVVAVVIAWFAILFTARYPKGLFNYVVGVVRWYNRVIAYSYILVTDKYPPFRLSA